MDKLDHRQLTLIKRAAEDAIHACNRHYGPFVDVVAHPLNIIALVEMAQSRQDEINALNDNHLAYIDKVIAMESDYLKQIDEKDKRIEEYKMISESIEDMYMVERKKVEAVEHVLGCAMIAPKEDFQYADRIGRALRGEHE